MSADGIKCQCRGILLLTGNLPIGHQSELDQGLEAVADAKHKAVSPVQKLHHLVLNHLVLESGRKKLRGTVRLIAGREAAREHNNL